MGILNVTPDSFFDGGKYNSVEGAVAHACQLVREGAESIDIGGASSRPGASIVSPSEECDRVLPVIEALSKIGSVPLSVDTNSAFVARKALDAGATIINDISAGRHDPDMIQVIAEYGCTVVLMHSRGTPQTMMQCIDYNDVVSDVTKELTDDIHRFRTAGVKDEQILIDPGIGFAKTIEQNIVLLHNIETIIALGYPVLLGTSRKSFIGAVTGKAVDERLPGTLGSIAAAFLRGVTHFRVHDVAATNDFLKVMAAVK